MYAAENEGESLLGHIKVGSSDEDEVGAKRTTVKEESSSDDSEGSAGWQDVNEEEKGVQVKEEEKDDLDDDTQTLGGVSDSLCILSAIKADFVLLCSPQHLQARQSHPVDRLGRAPRQLLQLQETVYDVDLLLAQCEVNNRQTSHIFRLAQK